MEGAAKKLTVSAYLSYDSQEPSPTREMRDIVVYCSNST
jgi:hypothetical protein